MRNPVAHRRGLAAVIMLMSACGGAAEEGTAAVAWDGSITAEGDVTTVINRAGSVWRPGAQLIEEASIGALEGAEEQMLGQIGGIASDGERIFVIDRQVPTVRIYDLSGRYLGEIGAAGEGPGEYESPASVAIDSAGRVLVRDDRGRGILVFSPAGEYIERYPMAGGLSTGTPMTIGPDDIPYTTVIVENVPQPSNRLWILGLQAHGPDGGYGEPIVPPEYDFEPGMIVSRSEGSVSMNGVPFYPGSTWAVTPELAVVSGVSDRYRFEVRRRNGSSLVVQKSWDPVPVDADEADWHRRAETASMRGINPGWVWNGPEIPSIKPAFSQFFPSNSGAIWVARPGPGERLPDCAEDSDDAGELSARPCWRDTLTLDLFDTDGRFLAGLDVPEGMSVIPRPFIDDDTLIARVEDAEGTVFVKRYRVVRQGSEET